MATISSLSPDDAAPSEISCNENQDDKIIIITVQQQLIVVDLDREKLLRNNISISWEQAFHSVPPYGQKIFSWLSKISADLVDDGLHV